MSTHRPERFGLLFAALCAALGAFVPGFAKLTTSSADALFVAVATSVFAGFSCVVLLLSRGELRELVARGRALRLAAIGVLGTAVAFALFFEGARRTSATDAILCLQMESAYALLISRLFLGHALTVRRVAAVGVLLAGIAVAVGGRADSESVGLALLLLCPLCWQVSHLIALRWLPGVKPRVLTGARYLFGSLALIVLWGARGAELGEGVELAAVLPWIAVQGVVLSFVGTMLWYETIARLDLTRATSIVVPSIPLLSIAASFVLVGEVPDARQVAGLSLVAAGVLAFVTAPHPHEAVDRIPVPTAPIAVPDEPSEGDS